MTDSPSSKPELFDKWLDTATAEQLREYIREYRRGLAHEPEEPTAPCSECGEPLLPSGNCSSVLRGAVRSAPPPKAARHEIALLADLLEQCSAFLFDDSGTPIAPMELRERVRAALARHAPTKEARRERNRERYADLGVLPTERPDETSAADVTADDWGLKRAEDGATHDR